MKRIDFFKCFSVLANVIILHFLMCAAQYGDMSDGWESFVVGVCVAYIALKLEALV